MNAIYEDDMISNLRNVVGINVLTGEACAYSMRLLCDVKDQSALDLLNDYFSVSLTLTSPWNSSIGSIMLSHAALVDIYIFSLLRANPCVVVYYDMSGMGCHNQYRMYDTYAERDEVHNEHPFLNDCAQRTWSSITNHPHSGSRNLHAFTGRYT